MSTGDLLGKPNKLRGSDGLASHPGEVEILLAASETGISFGSYMSQSWLQGFTNTTGNSVYTGH